MATQISPPSPTGDEGTVTAGADLNPNVVGNTPSPSLEAVITSSTEVFRRDVAHPLGVAPDTAIVRDQPDRTSNAVLRSQRTTFLTVAGVITVLYVATFIRGLWWQWDGILNARPGTPPVVDAAPRGATAARAGSDAQAPVQDRAIAVARKPLPRTDKPAPRNTTDDLGVSYDAEGVAVMGIDADPSGVYNVPPGRQVRIGGPAGQLYDVQDGGKLTIAKGR